ncbi:MAG TPA: nitrile hydratase accessory protein [Acidimicrobiales bacterium]|nr:nitrile hydratase accessory protein [Acidimicrobiales bacterium]
MSELPVELAITGPAAPPRSNGEMVFDAPWESRLFGVTMALVEDDRFAWSDFQQRLIAAVGHWEAEHPDGEGYRYYERWAEALESLLDDLGIVAVETTDARAHALAARPAGHDHGDRGDHGDHGQHGGHGSGPAAPDVA